MLIDICSIIVKTQNLLLLRDITKVHFWISCQNETYQVVPGLHILVPFIPQMVTKVSIGPNFINPFRQIHSIRFGSGEEKEAKIRDVGSKGQNMVSWILQSRSATFTSQFHVHPFGVLTSQ